ncbi:pre-60S factor REI1 [Geosmithia morbida]|uniref:Pre-60S factor REI1 n=1 Tax=Geosmithia morbida TaxID=1094350 RepID=A0A9P5CZW6_9HYPO|nr:pre-60S factor REI1 [Geosmithia morbida]KAF4122073.1 pre-60S factor REI1 [Geosmithia morbida]
MTSVAAQPATAGNSASHPYTCNTCQVAYRNIDLQKGHMKSDWHRYNLKRRVASLPPISADVFTEKVISARAATTVEAEKAYFERGCEVCQKTYYSENAFQNHLSSQKHKQNLASVSQRPDDETTSVVSSTFTLGDPVPVRRHSVNSDAEQEFNQVVEGFQRTSISKSEMRPSPVKRPSNPQPDRNGDTAADRESNNATPVQAPAEPSWSLTSCIFCNYNSTTVPLNVQHMERFHGMFIPEKEYLVDLDGLVKFLQETVHDGHECLYCGKLKPSVFGLQTHMRDKGHCKIPFTTEAEQLAIGDFYDFRSTYSDDDEDDDDDDAVKGGAKLGAARAANYVNEDGEEVSTEEADGWETDSAGEDDEPSDARTRSQGQKNARSIIQDEYELHLPTGKSIGHRSMNKYYRQNLHNYPTPEERAEREAIEAGRPDSDNDEDNKVATRNGRSSRAVVPRGAAGMTGVSDKKRENVQKAEQRGRTREAVVSKKKDYTVGKKLNNQKTYYYRYLNGG